MTADLPSDWFTPASVGTFAAASAAVLVVANTVRKLLGWSSVWVGFVIALVIVLVGANASGQLNTFVGILIAILNTCLLFCTVFGINEAVLGLAKTRTAIKAADRRALPWFSSWVA